jgi:transcriptional regulator CtsR
MLISDSIAKMIEKMLDDGDGLVELRRNDLASQLGCVPSQINYVITSRFTPEKGYITESRRGGGGYIRIVRVKMTKNEYLMHFFHAIGEGVDEKEGRAFLVNLLDKGIIGEREARMIAASISDGALEKAPREQKNSIRADILRHVILTLLV